MQRKKKYKKMLKKLVGPIDLLLIL